MRIRYFFLIAVSGLFFTDCRQEQPADDYTVLEGQTMGTYYRITYQDEKDRDFQSALDSLFVRINLQVSTYIDSSVISRFNRSADGLDLGPADAEANDHFLVNLALADIVAYLRQEKHVAAYKLPEHLLVLPAMPRNPVGKILKTELRVQARAVHGENAKALA